MATPPQVAANRENAQSSTGPRTAVGKSRSSANAITRGLFSARDFVPPEDREEYDQLRDELLDELQPTSLLEQAQCRQILSAVWRLHRCALTEEELAIRSPESKDTAAEQDKIDRAHSQAQRQLLSATAELRRLQTERQLRNELFPEGSDLSQFGVAGFRDIVAAMRRAPHTAERSQSNEAAPAKQTQFPAPATPRNAPCPCRSGLKFKRCCGRNAPALLKAG